MKHLTEEQVLQLAPDAASLKSGKDLASPKKWLNHNYNERVLWGEVQGSAIYRTQVDMISTAFKCNCPSRKFPCKHGLGLLLLFAQNPNIVTPSDDEPAWVKEWIDKRQAKAETAATKPAEVEVDDKTDAKRAKDKEKRENDRLTLVQAGAAELELWLKDLLRGGLLSFPDKGVAFFEKTAARMVDAKATGLANRIRGFNKINYFNGNNWHSEVLEQAAETFLLLESFKNISQQTPSVQEDIRSFVGWSLKKNELLEDNSQEVVADKWLVLGRMVTQEDDLTTQRIWLFGAKTARFALILDFAYKNTPFQNLLVNGSLTQADLVFYPSNAPFRAVIKNQGINSSDIRLDYAPLPNWLEAQIYYVEKLSLNPWIDQLPLFMGQLTLHQLNEVLFLRDKDGYIMRLNDSFTPEKVLQLLALTGGSPTDMFVLKTQDTVIPLGVLLKNQYKTIKL